MESPSLPPEQQASYTVIIDGILATADLNTISSKRVREGLQRAVQYDITPQKDAIKQLIVQRFDKFHAEKESKAQVSSATEHESIEVPANGKTDSSAEPRSASPAASKRKADTETLDTVSEPSGTPPPKKKRKNEDELDADAALAAKLQAEEDARSRSTRRGATRKAAAPPKKKTPKKKTKSKRKSKVTADDDSDLDGSGAEKKVNRNSAFHKPLTLSPALSALFGGETQLSRPQATKKVWAYIKANDLQDPDDKRQIRCDDAMRAVFKTDKINMFAMTKVMGKNMYTEGE